LGNEQEDPLNLKKMIIVIIAAAMTAAVATIITKSFGMENASPMIGGAVGGAVGGAIAWNFGKKN
jgi:hypothetical protein